MKRKHIKLSKHLGFNSVWSSSLEGGGGDGGGGGAVLCWMWVSLISWLEQRSSFLRNPLSHVSGFVPLNPAITRRGGKPGRHIAVPPRATFILSVRRETQLISAATT